MARRKTRTSTGLKNPKSKVSVTITSESKKNLDKIVAEIGLSKSAFFEKVLSGSIAFSSQKSEQLVTFQAEEQEDSTQKSSLEVIVSQNPQESQENKSEGNQGEIIAEQESTIASLKEQITKLETDLENKHQQEKQLQKQVQEQQTTIDVQEADLEKRNQKQQEIETKINEQTSQISHLTEELEKAQEDQYIALANESTKLISEKDDLLQQRNQQINQLEQDIINKQKATDSLTQDTANLQAKIDQQKHLIQQLQQQLTTQQISTNVLPQINSNLSVNDSELTTLRETVTYLQKRINSRANKPLRRN